MADIARGIMQQKYRQIPVEIDAFKESDRSAFGNGSGIM